MATSTRTTQQEPRPVPLAVWAYALAFAFLLFWQLHNHLIGETPRSEAFHLHNEARLESLARAVDAGAIGVVLIGDSRLRYATPQDDEFSTLLTERLGRPVRVVRIAHDWAVFDDFAGLAPSILAAHPTLLVLQEELFAKERETPSRLLLGRSYLLWQIKGRGPWNPGDKDQALYQSEQRCDVLPDIDAEARRQRSLLWVAFDPNGANARAIAAYRDEAEAQGVGTAVLSLPITGAGRAILPAYHHPQDGRTLAMAGTIPDADFCDVVHMNADGRAAFTAWLLPNLAARLEAATR